MDLFSEKIPPASGSSELPIPRQVSGLSRTGIQSGSPGVLQTSSRTGSPRPLSGFSIVPAQKEWVVYANPPVGGPEQVLRYLARYTHRVAISNGRLVSLEDGRVRFRWRDSQDHNQIKEMSLDAVESPNTPAAPLFPFPTTAREGHLSPNHLPARPGDLHGRRRVCGHPNRGFQGSRNLAECGHFIPGPTIKSVPEKIGCTLAGQVPLKKKGKPSRCSSDLPKAGPYRTRRAWHTF